MLVQKFLYDVRRPTRWEVAVFHFPGEPSQAYVKRVVGLPGRDDPDRAGRRLDRRQDRAEDAQGTAGDAHPGLRQQLRAARRRPLPALGVPPGPARAAPRERLAGRGDAVRPRRPWSRRPTGSTGSITATGTPSGAGTRRSTTSSATTAPTSAARTPSPTWWSRPGSPPGADARAVAVRIDSGSDGSWSRSPSAGRGRRSVTRNRRKVAVVNPRGGLKPVGRGPGRPARSLGDGPPADGGGRRRPRCSTRSTTTTRRSARGRARARSGSGRRGGGRRFGDVRVYRDVYYTSALAFSPRRPFGVDSPFTLGRRRVLRAGGQQPGVERLAVLAGQPGRARASCSWASRSWSTCRARRCRSRCSGGRYTGFPIPAKYATFVRTVSRRGWSAADAVEGILSIMARSPASRPDVEAAAPAAVGEAPGVEAGRAARAKGTARRSRRSSSPSSSRCWSAASRPRRS